MSPSRIPAAQYLRMSTDLQEHSLENQAEAIGEYAHRCGFSVVRTYRDAARSGLFLKHRPGLQRLLADVLAGNLDYEAVLVYDVSRWGRFQDIDEAAYYEFLCRRAGVPVHYCTEQFANDGTMSSSIIKALKRSMAAEYSRELGVKSYAGQKHLALLGFRVGGQAGYGLRRVLLSPEGKKKQVLRPFEYKNLTTDRVILIPGTRAEVKCIREIFHLALHKRISEVLQDLNSRGVPFLKGQSWTYSHVYRIVTNPKYAGCNVWGRSTQKLRSKRRPTTPDQWAVKPGAFKAIVDQDLFDRVQAAHKHRSQGVSNAELLRKLGELLKKKGELSESIIRRATGMSSKSTYVSHFGSVVRAYELVGYIPSSRQRKVHEHLTRMKSLRKTVIDRIAGLFPDRVRHCRLRNHRPGLRLDGNLVLSVLIASQYKTPLQQRVRWKVHPYELEAGLVTLLCLANSKFDDIQHFYVMPGINIRAEYQIKGIRDPWLRRGQRLSTIQDFCSVVQATASQLEQCSFEVPEVAPSARRVRYRSPASQSIYPPDGIPRIGLRPNLELIVAPDVPIRDRTRHRKDFGRE